MANEGKYIADQIERLIRLVREQLQDLTDEDLNRILPFQPSNTLFQLGTHILGSARYWSITLVGGPDYQRNRESEFTAVGRGLDLLADIDLYISQLHATLDAVPGSEMERPTTGHVRFSRPVGGEGPLPLRHGVLHALEHTALHFGHIQITRQVLGFAPPSEEG